MSLRPIVPPLLAVALLLSGCARRSAESPPLDPAFALPSPTAAAAVIESPGEGEAVASPIWVSGLAPAGEGMTVAVQVKSRSDDGQWRWIGNLALDVADDGRFEGEVDYTLDGPAPGAVELVIVDQATGSVVQASEIAVELLPSR